MYSQMASRVASGQVNRHTHPVVLTGVLAIAHRLTLDDEYKGYYIPKGSTVFVNVWYVLISFSDLINPVDRYNILSYPRALLKDEEYYPDPDVFLPERFLKDGKINPKVADPIPNFGFGRRFVLSPNL